MANIKSVGEEIAEKLKQKLDICGQMVVRDAVKMCPKDNGQLRASWSIKRYEKGIKIKFHTEYAYYVHKFVALCSNAYRIIG